MTLSSSMAVKHFADVCVIVRTCGRPVFLRRALGSIAEQTVQPKQIVVIAEGDDGRSVQTVVSGSWTGPIETVSIVSNPVPVGRGAALNQGLHAARTTWIAILDDDDTWEPTFLEQTISAATEPGAVHRGVATWTTEIVEREQAGVVRELFRHPFCQPRPKRLDVQSIAGGNLFTINAFLYSRECALRIGGYRTDLSVLEDWEFNARYLAQYPVVLLPEPLACYHKRPAARGAAANTAVRDYAGSRALIQECWLRQDMEQGCAGLGLLSMIADLRRELDLFIRLRRFLVRIVRFCLGRCA